MENAQVIVILDTSGSMNEMGKLLLARNLVSYLRQCIALELYTWNEQLDLVDLASDQDMPSFVAARQADLNSLRDFLNSFLANSDQKPVLLLSDGSVPASAVSSFAKWRKEHANLILEAVAIGADANRAFLKTLVAPGLLFEPENVGAALAAVLNRTGEVPSPVVTADIKFNAANVEDEW